MELKEYLYIIYKRLWLVILLPIIASGISAYVSYFVLEPVYESNTTLYVINKKDDSQLMIAYNDLMASQLMVKDYRELVKSRTVTGTVIKELDLTDLTPEKLASRININSKNDTRIIEIRIQDNSPERAREIADKTGEVFIKKVTELMRVDNVSIVDKAQTPRSPIKPNPLMNIAVASMVGLMMAVGIVIIIEYLDDTLKTSDDVEKHLGTMVLGTIPEFSLR